MDASKRLGRIRNQGHHLLYMAIVIGAGYLIAMVGYALLLFLVRSI